MDHIFDNVGVDAREALKLVVPISASAGVFPVASGQKGGLRLDDTLGNMFYSDGTNWRQVGSVLSVGLSASGALAVSGSPVTTSGVINLNWTGTTSQYVRGDGSLNTFPTIPVVQWSDSLVAFGRTSVGGLTYDSYFKYHYTEHALTIGTRAAGTVGGYGLLIGTNNLSTLDISLIVGTNCTNNEYYSLIVGNNIVNNGRYSLNVGYNQTNTSAGEYSVIVGTGNSNVFSRSLIIGSSITSTGSGSESIIGGSTHTLTTIAYGIISGYGHNLNASYYSFIAGRENIVTSAHGVNVLGRKGEAIHDGVTMLLDYTGAVISSTASHQLTARFTNGYRFMVSASSRAMDISSSRVVTIDNLSGAGTRMVVANASGELSTQTIPSGTVTSVGASVTASTALTVSGSPITTSGVLAFSWTGTTSQYVRGNGTLDTFPTIPVVNDNTITLSAGTGLIGGGAFTLNQASNDTITFTLNAGLNDLTDVVLSSPSNGQIIQYNGTNWVNVTPTWTSNTGTVTSVALALPSDTFTISGSPVTTSGTLTGTYKSQTKKFVLAAPWGVDGTPFWRQLHPSDLQQSGATTGQVIMWDGTAWNPASGGSGTVTSVGASVTASTALTVSGSPITSSGVLAFSWTGTSAQYVRGNGTLATMPTVNWSDGRIAYGVTGVGGLSHSSDFLYNYATGAMTIGTRAVGTLGTYTLSTGLDNLVSGSYSTASGYNHTVLANYCFVSGNANTQTNSSGVGSFLSGREISHGTGSYLFASGFLLTVSGHYSFTVGTENTNSGTYSAIIGRNGTVTHSGNVMLLDSGSGTNITSGTSNQFTARFYNGYRFMTTNTVRAMDISSSRVITIDNLAGSGTRMVVANSSGELSTQTIPSGANSVWYIQGTATDATTNSQDIVRTGRVRIGASGSSSYMLSVVGDAYITTGTIVNNNQAYKGYSTAVSPVNLIKINSSNYVEVGQSSYDIYLANYTSGRSADTVSTSDKYLYVNSSGYLKADSAKWVRNDGASAYITSSQSHAADSTNRKVKFDVANFANNGYYGLGGSSGDYRINFPSGDTYHFVVVTLEYTTSGTPTVTATLRRVSTTIETNVSTSADGRKVMTIHTMMSGSGTSDYPTVYLSVSGSAITLQKCRMTVIPMGAVPP